MLPSTLWSYLAQWLAFTSSTVQNNGAENETKQLTFELRHMHAHAGQRVLFADVPPLTASISSQSNSANGHYTLRTRRIEVYRPRSQAHFIAARHRSRLYGQSAIIPWDPDEVDGPDVNSRETLLMLAKMTYNAYVEPTDKDWYELGEEWPEVCVHR